MNLMTENGRTKLFQAMNKAYSALEPFRAVNQTLIEDYAGPNYGNKGDRPDDPLSLLNQAVEAYTMSLVANCPTATVDTNLKELKFFAKKYAVAINNMLQDIALDKTLQNWVLDAIFMLGIIKVHIADSVEVELFDGEWIDPGTPMASNVLLDDFVFDMTAKRWEQIKYAADCYRVPFSVLKGNQFDQEVVKQLIPSQTKYSTGTTERVDNMSKVGHEDQDDLEEMVDVMDVWIPSEYKIYTFAMDQNKKFTGKFGPLCVLDSDFDPYNLLSFGAVPGNIMPAAPAVHLAALERLANNLFRKQSRRAKQQKDVFTYTPAGADAAKRVKTAGDGEWVQVQENSEVGTMKIGGVDANNQAFLLNVIQQYDRMAGNLSAMLGLGPQADTLGQEQLIVGASSKKEASMRSRVHNGTKDLVRKLAMMIWDDPVKVIPGRIPIDGVESYSIDGTWTPEKRMGHFHDYLLDIDVHSMPYQPPQQKAQSLSTLLTTVYAPMGALLQQQGGQINMQALTEEFAELLNMPRLRNIITFISASAGGDEQLSVSSPQTTRNYVRRSVSGGMTPQGKSMEQEQAWLSQAGKQDSAMQASGQALGA